MSGKAIVAAAILVLGASGQTLWAPKGQPAQYTPPHKPHTKLPDLKARHAGKAEWRELIVNDEHLRSEYLFAKPGTKTPRMLHPDTRTWWVVMEGEVRFDIETVPPFVARKGSIVNAPMATLFSYEVVGDKPALIFETNIAGAKTLYESQMAAPKIPGLDWVSVKFPREAGKFGRNNKAHTTFDEVAQALEQGRLKGTQRIVEDDGARRTSSTATRRTFRRSTPRTRGTITPRAPSTG